jgi:hypothetical protein
VILFHKKGMLRKKERQRFFAEAVTIATSLSSLLLFLFYVSQVDALEMLATMELGWR